jgi:hypothetical protein
MGQQLANAVVLDAAAPLPETPAPAEQLVAPAALQQQPDSQHFDAAAAGIADQQQLQMQQLLQQQQAQVESLDKQQQQQQHYVQLPAHLAGMQHVLDGMNPELLNPGLATQDFTAAIHHAGAPEGTA